MAISHLASTVARTMHSSSEVLIPSVRKNLTQNAAARVLVTGATGRLGQTLVPELTERGMRCISTSRSAPKKPDQVQMTFKESTDDLSRMLEKHSIHAVLNAAAASSGELDEMLPVNTQAPVRMAEAARMVGIPFVQVSTTATQILGVTKAKPYAYSKQLAEQMLQEKDHARIARLDVLLGCDSKIDLSLLAAIGKFLPVGLQIGGIDSTIQPTTYEAASKALASFTQLILAGEDHRTEINIAGHPVKMSDFIRMVGNSAYELHVPIESLHGLAKLVNEGSLTQEFLRLAVISNKNPIIHDTADFQSLHGTPIPSVDDVVAKVHETVSFGSLLDAGKRVLSRASITGLARETSKILSLSDFRRA